MKSPLVLQKFALLLWYLMIPLTLFNNTLRMYQLLLLLQKAAPTSVRKLEKSFAAYTRKNVEGESSCLREKMMLFY